MAKSILGAALVLALAGCGGGGSEAEMTAFVRTSCHNHITTVSLLGDSTMLGTGILVQEAMTDRFGAGSVAVSNYAVGGTTSAQAQRHPADIVVANYGINDMRQGVSIAQFKANMIAAHATIIETQSPIADRSLPESEYVAAAASLGIAVADTNAYVLSRPDWQSMLVDGIHPDEALYEDIVTYSLAPAIEAQVLASCLVR